MCTLSLTDPPGLNVSGLVHWSTGPLVCLTVFLLDISTDKYRPTLKPVAVSLNLEMAKVTAIQHRQSSYSLYFNLNLDLNRYFWLHLAEVSM